MTEKRNITEEDVLLKLRIGGAGVEVKGPLLWESTDKFVDVTIVFNDRYMVVETRLNPRSRLQVIIEGNDATISEMGEVLRTGTLEPRAPWRDALMSDGTTVDSATMGMNMVSYILTFARSLKNRPESCSGLRWRRMLGIMLYSHSRTPEVYRGS